MRSAAAPSWASSMQRSAAWQKPVDRPITKAAQTPLSANWGSPSSQVSLPKEEGKLLWMECPPGYQRCILVAEQEKPKGKQYRYKLNLYG